MKTESLQLWKRETIAGLTTFLTMSYIIVVNPTILSSPGTGMSFSGVLTATVLISFLMTLMMGLYAKLPFAVAPGMGINAFFTYTLILGMQIPWEKALGAVFWAGVLFLIISVTSLREAIARAMPPNLRVASAVGIGIFLTFIGLKNLNLIVSDPVTLVKYGSLQASSILGLLGMLLTVALMRKKSPFAFLGGIFFVTAAAWMFGISPPPTEFVSQPDFTSVFLKADLWGSLQVALIPAILAVALTDLFDSISTFVGVSKSTNLVDEKGNPLRLREGLIVDAFATLGAGLAGTSSGTAYIESASGIEMGGRTGRTAIVTALCFLPCFFIAPLAASVPAFATAPILIVVGALMFKTAKSLSAFSDLEDLLPAFLTIVLIPLTFSITQGLLWGFISHVLLYMLAGRRKQIPPLLYFLALISVILLAVEQRWV